MLCKSPLISLLACAVLPQVLITSCAAQASGKAVGGSSQLSQEIKVTPSMSMPGTPKSLVTWAGDKSVHMAWDRSDDAASYNVYRASNGSSYQQINQTGIDSSSYTDSGLVNGTVYSYYVTGVNKAGESAASPIANSKPTTTLFTSAQAIKVAKDFCNAIGQPVTATPSAVFPEPKVGADRSGFNWQPKWQIEFPGQAEVDVVDGSNLVVWYMVDDRAIDDSKQGPQESQAKALQTYSHALAASGVDIAELGPPSITTDESGQNWEVEALRVFHRISYIGQDVDVSLHARSGTVDTFALRFKTPSPTSDDRTITKAQAEDLATAILTKLGMKNVSCDDAQLEAIQPNTLFQPQGSEDPLPGPAVVGWNCCFIPEKGESVWVWISGKDGSALGGTIEIVD